MTALNLIVIYTADLERTRQFYQALGLQFAPEQHGRGPAHYAASLGDVVLEIYPASETNQVSGSLRLGFTVGGLESLLEQFEAAGDVRLIRPAEETPWGRRAVLCDWEGRRVELLEKVNREGRCC